MNNETYESPAIVDIDDDSEFSVSAGNNWVPQGSHYMWKKR
jgi:hypothetical protein